MNLKPQLDRYKPYSIACLLLFGCVSMANAQQFATNPSARSFPADHCSQEITYQNEPASFSTDLSRLRRQHRKQYMLDAGDVLGVFIEGVLGESGSNPPVHYSRTQPELPPAMGFPTPVRDNGTISLPLIKPLSVRGLTISQAESLVKRTFLEGGEPILIDSNRVLVTLMQKRTYSVTVIRQDNSQSNSTFYRGANRNSVSDRSDQSSRSSMLQMPAYDNDLLSALIQTGGIPGLNAQPTVSIHRPSSRQFQSLQTSPASSQSPFPRSNQSASFHQARSGQVNLSSSIPIRSNQPHPNFGEEEIVLRDGDVVQVNAQPTQVFYTGGLLGGGEFPLPRDTSLDVIQAMAVSGYSTGVGSFAGSGIPPTELIVSRNVPGRTQYNFRVDVANAINNPSARPKVAPGDILILRYTPAERAANLGIQAYRLYGIRALLSN